MKANPTATAMKAGLDPALEAVRDRMAAILLDSPLGDREGEGAVSGCVEGGKMLRARLVLRLAPACGASEEAASRSATAVELVHAASLLHDDVIDGGHLRRSQPTFWVQHGVQAAILVGDLLLCEAGRMLEIPGEMFRLHDFMERTAEVCRAEVEQELVLRGAPADWDTAVRLARQKTGALFAFCAVAACGPDEAQQPVGSALREAGYRAGTAYQLSDDVLDVRGDAKWAGKTLGRDRERDKITAGSRLGADENRVREAMADLRLEADVLLAPYPDVAAAWRTYWDEDLRPAMDWHLHPAAVCAVS